MMKDEETYQTSDFNLATYLYSQGVLLDAIISSPRDSRRKLFVFKNAPDDLIKLFQAGKAETNVLSFTNAQNTLRTMLREAS